MEGSLLATAVDTLLVPLQTPQSTQHTSSSGLPQRTPQQAAEGESASLDESGSASSELRTPQTIAAPIGLFFDDIPSRRTVLPLHGGDIFSVSSIRSSFRSARASSVSSLSVTSTTTEETKPVREKSRMSVADLLSLIVLLETEKIMVNDKPNADDNDEMEDYGLLEAEEAATADMYEDEKMEDRPATLMMTRTRSSTRMPPLSRLHLHQYSRLQSRMTHSSTRRHQSSDLSQSDSDSDSDTLLEIEQTPEIISANPPAEVQTLADQPEGLSIYFNHIFTQLTHGWYEKLARSFSNYIGRVILDDDREMIPSLIEIHKKTLVCDKPYTIITSLDTYLSSLMMVEQPSMVFFGCLIRQLIYAPCSESSVERVFSKLRFICGKHRYNLSLKSLNASLVVSDQKRFLQSAQTQQTEEDHQT